MVNDTGNYGLNHEAGVAVDVTRFDAAADAGEREARAGDQNAAKRSYHEAVRTFTAGTSMSAPRSRT